MTVARSASQVIKKIGEEKLKLHRGEGYWYFEYDDFVEKKIYDTESIYIPYLCHWSLENWVEAGKSFIQRTIESQTK